MCSAISKALCSDLHIIISWPVSGFGCCGRIHVSRLAFAWEENQRPPPAAALGTTVFILYCRRPDAHPAGFYERLRRASVLAVFLKMVFVGSRFHYRSDYLS